MRRSVQLDDSYDLELIVSELVTNVVRHVGSEIRLTVRPGDPVRVEVHNHQSASEAFTDLLASGAPPEPSAIGGRGLALVRALASRVGLDSDPNGGKVIWFEYVAQKRIGAT